GIKARIEDLKASMPEGVELVVTYDRSTLIRDAMNTLRDALLEEMLVVLAFIALFLMHLRSSLVAVLVLPLAVLASFIPTYLSGVTVNIMSLAGIIIAIGDMVDGVVVLVEDAHRRIEAAGEQAHREDVIIAGAKKLVRPIFASLLLIAVSFLPVFALEAQEGRLFRPLAFTFTFAMAVGAILTAVLAPALMILFIKGKVRPESANPINRAAIAAYRPVLAFLLRRRRPVLALAVLLVASTAWPFTRIGSEFMPPLDEGSYLFMPVTFPNVSIEEAKRLLQVQDRIIKSFPEVKSVFGKAGRAETPTDNAPLSMFETVIVLKPQAQWRPGITRGRLEAELGSALELPGIQNALTMPIKARVDMLTTGIRTPVGVKVFGDDLVKLQEVGQEIERRLRSVPGTRSAYADRETGGAYVDFAPDREAVARYGLRVEDVFDVFESAVGGLVIDQTIEGRERFTINVRYPRELRADIDRLERVLVPARTVSRLGGGGAMGGDLPPAGGEMAHVPLAHLGRIEVRSGPPM
ncbi:MAG: efflux RND transporter permease subunit, partial [Candidatus Methylomirabilis sp.]|nr:efflux RND transporter permease subunit [Deltaproteobacteria bacterium]